MKKPKQLRPPKLTDSERHKRFVDTARIVEASEKSEDFDKAFRELNVRKSVTAKAAYPAVPGGPRCGMQA
jgi:hypothetical protein